MGTPIDTRVNPAPATPTGYIVPSGIKAFKDSLKGPDAATAFMTWRNQLFTKNLYRALQDLIVHQPIVQHESLLVQYGMTLGLTLASQLVTDPSVIWPDVFGPGMTAVKSGDETHPPEEFKTSVDDILDDDHHEP
jgi:hypothetical protein